MKTKIRGKGLVIAVTLGAVLLGVTAYSATTNILIEGTIPNSRVFNGSVKVTVRTLTIKPGEALPWHYHPGYAFNVVKSGTLTVEDGCGGEVSLTPGQGFEEMDSHVHRGRNNSNADVVVYDTFITRAGEPTTVTFAERRCGPPNEVDECKDNGWRKFNHPQSFSNEGQCISFARDMRRNTKPF